MEDIIAGLWGLKLGSDKFDERQSVPLESVEARIDICETLAEVCLTQHFHNKEDTTVEAVYRFPVDEEAAVCGFEAIVGDKRVIGVCKANEDAKKEYDDAVEAGHGAYLLEQVSADVFELKVGNILPGQQCTIKVTYVTLTGADKQRLRFVLPTRVMPRYVPKGSSEGSSSSSSSTPTRPLSQPWKQRKKRRLNPKEEALSAPGGDGNAEADYQLDVEVYTNLVQAITKIESPSHIIKKPEGAGEKVPTATFASSEQLDRDFVLLLTLYETSDPIVITEYNEKTSSFALLMSLIPSFKAEDVRSELIFVVDRSGSMSGDPMAHASEALSQFLDHIPDTALFNIVGFGSQHEILFKKSVFPTKKNMKKAKLYTREMDANFGGTEVLKPLEEIYRQEVREGYSRQIFLLTDGGVSDTDEVIKTVRLNSDTTRLFSFGIGYNVSTALVKGVARAGDGIFEFVTRGENLASKVTHILKQALQPAVTSVSIDWGDLDVIQVPFKLRPIFQNEPYRIFAFIQGEEFEDDMHVELKGILDDEELGFEMDINVKDNCTSGRLVHCLAAREAIRDLEQQCSVYHQQHEEGELEGDLEEVVKNRIIELGVKYSLASKHTSFIAIEKRNDDDTESDSDSSSEGEGKRKKKRKKKHPERRVIPQHPSPPKAITRSGGAAPQDYDVFSLFPSPRHVIMFQENMKNRVFSPFGGNTYIDQSAKQNSKGIFYGPEGVFHRALFGPRAIGGRKCWLTSALALIQTIEPIRLRAVTKGAANFPSSFLMSFLRFSNSWSSFGIDGSSVTQKRRELSEATRSMSAEFAKHGFGDQDYSPCDAVRVALLEIAVLFKKVQRRIGRDSWICLHYRDYRICGKLPKDDFGPEYLVFLNPSALAVSRSLEVPGYAWHSLVSLHTLTFAGTVERTVHFTVLTVNDDGYFVYDDGWNFGEAGFQGGLLQKGYESGVDQFFENVPVFIFKKVISKRREY